MGAHSKMKPLISELFPMTLHFCDDEESHAKAVKMTRCASFDSEHEAFGHFPPPGGGHTIALDGDGGLQIIVTIGEQDSESQAISVIIHESVHVWQFTRKALGEKHPGAETEAYAIQYYANWMIEQYKGRRAKQTKKTKRSKK